MVFSPDSRRVVTVVEVLKSLRTVMNEEEKRHDGKLHRPKFFKRLASNFKNVGLIRGDSLDGDEDEAVACDVASKVIQDFPNFLDRLNWCIDQLIQTTKTLRRNPSSLMLMSSMGEGLNQNQVREEDKDVVEGLRKIFSERDEESNDLVVVTKRANAAQPSRKYAIRRSNSATLLKKKDHRRQSDGGPNEHTIPFKTRSKSHHGAARTHEKMKVWMGKMALSNSTKKKKDIEEKRSSESSTLSLTTEENKNIRGRSGHQVPASIPKLRRDIAFENERVPIRELRRVSEHIEEEDRGWAERKLSAISSTSTSSTNVFSDVNDQSNNIDEEFRSPTYVSGAPISSILSDTSAPNQVLNGDVVEIETVANRIGIERERPSSNPQESVPISKPIDFGVKKRFITRTHTMAPRRRRQGAGPTVQPKNALQMSLNISSMKFEEPDVDFFKPGPIKKQKSLEDLTTSTTFNESHRQLLKKEAFVSCVDALRRDSSITRLLDVITPPVLDLLTLSPRWDLDVLKLENLTNYCPLACLALKHITDRDLFAKLPIDPVTCLRFFSRIENMYLPHDQVVYHNNTHGADVLHSTAGLLDMAPFFTPMETFSAIVAAACHDVGHPGYTNNFLITTNHDFAIFYNDKSVLENFHIATAFKLMKDDPFCDILAHFSEEDKKKMRRLMISMVLGTDMTRHARHVNEFKEFVDQCGEKVEEMDVSRPAAVLGEDITMKERSLVLSYVLHCADLGACTKPWNQTYKWSLRVLNEFWLEGDEERRLGLPVGQLNERIGVEIAQSQYGFVKFVCEPLWKVWDEFVSPNSPSLAMKNLTANLMLWEARREYEKTAPPISTESEDVAQSHSIESSQERLGRASSSRASTRTKNNQLTSAVFHSASPNNRRSPSTSLLEKPRTRSLHGRPTSSSSSSRNGSERHRGNSLSGRKLPSPNSNAGELAKSTDSNPKTSVSALVPSQLRKKEDVAVDKYNPEMHRSDGFGIQSTEV
eukprot:m.23933 g.23933  ORF g.23933 m.23933 type:complete len:989 (-) comp5598_c0_seq1:290-3256(-)